MKTLRLPRAKSPQSLTYLLCALLACPANLPTLDREPHRAGFESFASASSNPGLGLHKPDRKSTHCREDWSVVADEPEGSAGREDSRYFPLALPDRPLDLPSLVPAPLDARPVARMGPVVPNSRTIPLRC